MSSITLTGMGGSVSAQGGIDSFTALMLHMDSSFVDSSLSPRTITVGGAASIDTSIFKFGGGSGFFDGTLSCAYTPSIASSVLGTGNFTIDAWINVDNLGLNQVVWCSGGSFSINQNYYKFGLNSSDQLMIYGEVAGAARLNYNTTSAAILLTNTWYHVAVVRNGTSILMFVNGVSQALTTSVAISTNAMPDVTGFTDIVGAQNSIIPTVIQILHGWIDEFRFSPGVSRWTSNFTPPAAPYTT